MAVVGARFLVPLLIPRFPLPAVIASLVLDALDQTIFQWFGYDPPGYQGYDKAMDVYYLAIAYLATLRNWASAGAFLVGRALYFYRLVGVLLFELAHTRALLLFFPNTFEYFFIAYELVRTRWDNRRLLIRDWIIVAAAIWIFVKIPQEYWIHIAHLDVTDTLADYPWAWPLLIGAILLALGIFWFVIRPRLPQPDWPFRLAADAPPEAMDEETERVAWRQEHGRLWSATTLEKVALVSLLSVIFAQTLPGVRSSNLELGIGTAILVVVNAAITLAMARRDITIESVVASFGVRVVLNAGLVLLASLLLGARDINEAAGLFFIVMLSLLTTLHDRWLPVHDIRTRESAPATPN